MVNGSELVLLNLCWTDPKLFLEACAEILRVRESYTVGYLTNVQFVCEQQLMSFIHSDGFD